MICLDCGNTDIRYDEKEKSYHCNNCGSRNLGDKEDSCKYMVHDGLCGKETQKLNECKTPCIYYKN